MKLATFRVNNKTAIGCKVDDYLLHLTNAYNHFLGNSALPHSLTDMRTLIENDDESMAIIKELTMKAKNPDARAQLLAEQVLYQIDNIEFMAPILNPEKVMCIGLNYRDHCEEQNHPIPDRPTLFSKFNTALIGHEADIVSPKLTEQLDYEAELAFVIGKSGKDIPVNEALDYVFGYTVFNDVSARDIQFGDRQWLRGKSFDTFAPTGPFLVTKEEIDDPHDLAIKSRLNGKVMQDSNTGNMIFDIPHLINFISQVVTLAPGDIVASGTPAGVGVFRDPPVFMTDGSEIGIEIEKLGILTNHVIAQK